MLNVAIVIPTYNERKNILELILSYSTQRVVLSASGIYMKLCIIDDTVDGEDLAFVDSVYWVKRYWYGCNQLGYGKSLDKGIELCEKFDIIITMDADHPIDYLPRIVELLKKRDVVVGVEGESNLQRKVTGFLCRKYLGLNLEHPTCGFIGFNRNVLNVIPYDSARSNHDIHHVEWLLMCKKHGFEIGEFRFDGHKGKRKYNIGRYLRWMKDFMRLVYSTDKDHIRNWIYYPVF